MPDDLTILRPHDSRRINMNEPHEVRYWTDRFNITERELREIISKVGDSVDAVENYLRNSSK
ncbi:MAG: DUF3606 domain-containing protein [Lachnospiraceae bacterium]|nr:DUF3606 domain-containing protein [Lachnospiraceae bacterium]